MASVPQPQLHWGKVTPARSLSWLLCSALQGTVIVARSSGRLESLLNRLRSTCRGLHAAVTGSLPG